MTNLTCSAVSCRYNDHELCTKDHIIVGNQGNSCCETSCTSFQHRDSGGYSNCCSSCSCGHSDVDVSCNACDCRYNNNKQCTAASIDISGESSSGHQTHCKTFWKGNPGML